MQILGRSLLQRNVLSSAFTFTTARHHSVLSSTTRTWSKSEKCQFIQPFPTFQHQQVRFRRHDRASAFTKPRPKTKKQRQEYNRRLKKITDEKAKHNPPGVRAGPRRQFIRERWQHLLDTASGKELVALGDTKDDEYGVDDALMEDLFGNTAYLHSQPTPEPIYLGHRHQEYYDLVKRKMDRYREALDARSKSGSDDPDSKGELLDLSTCQAKLPSDASISKVLRAFRDRNGTRSRPIGIAMALEHILKDLGVPIVAFGELTYTTLLTCCRTPVEVSYVSTELPRSLNLVLLTFHLFVPGTPHHETHE